MINVQQITSQLARLPDQALQQYAAMHKNDPYIMALALSESNRRKQMREGAQMAAPEQPKVVDQEIANMAAPMPEDVGIAQLPMNNPGYASGGIVAFDEGGPVERYQSQGLVQPPTYGTPYAIPGMVQPPRAIIQQAGAPENTPLFQRLFQSARSEGERYKLAQAQQRIAMGTATQADRDLVARAALPDMGAASLDEQAAINAAIAAPTRPAPTAKPPASTGAAPGVDTTGTAGGTRPLRPAAPAAPAAAAAAVPAAGLLSLDPREMLKREMETAAKQPVPQEAELKEVGKERVQAKEEYEKGLEAIHKKFDDIYKGKRERLAAKGTEIEKMKDQGIGLALLQAGAAMMSTPGGLGVALGKGVKVGTEQYASGLERLRSAQEKLSDAQDRLEEAEAQRGEMSARELLKARSDIKNTGISAREDMIKFYMERDKVNRETALKMVDNQIQVGIAQFREAEATKRTGMEIEGRMRAANAPSGQERIALALGKGNLEAGLRKVAEIQAGKFDPKKAYTEYLVAAQKTPGSDLLTYSQFIGQFAIPTSPGNNPAVAPGTVRERP